jgi:hypothetical protein
MDTLVNLAMPWLFRQGLPIHFTKHNSTLSNNPKRIIRAGENFTEHLWHEEFGEIGLWASER